MQGAPENDRPGTLTVEQVRAEFERLLRDRNHMGVRNLIGDTVLEPRNPFQRTPRSPKKWVAALIGLGLLVLLNIVVFHAR